MVKGVSKQVIVVQSPDPKIYEQAIFILREDAKEVTDAMLLKEAGKIVQHPKLRRLRFSAPMWAGFGAACTAVVWLISAML